MLRQTAQLLLAAALLGYAAVDATLAFTAPLGGNWQAGSKNYITWIDHDGKGMPESTDFYLVSGDATALQLVATVASGVSTASGSYEWTIPTDIAPGEYAIRAGTNDAYSPFFTISGADSKTTSTQSTIITSATTTAKSTKSKSYAATVTVTVTADKSGVIIDPTPTASTSSTTFVSSAPTESSASATASFVSSEASESSVSASASSVSSEASVSSVVSSATSVLSSVASSVSSVLSSATETSNSEALPSPTQETTTESENGVGQIIPSALVVSAAMILGYIANLV